MFPVGMPGIMCRGLTRLQSPADTQWTFLSLSCRTWEESENLCFFCVCCVFDFSNALCMLVVHLSLSTVIGCQSVVLVCVRTTVFLSVVDRRNHNALLVFRLREKCELILLLSCSYRRKTEELLWKKAFYEVVQRCKMHKQVSRYKAFPL